MDDIGSAIDMAAARTVDQSAWVGRLSKTKDRLANLPTVANALVIFANDPAVQGLLAFNTFSGQFLLTKAPPSVADDGPPLPGPYPREWKTGDAIFIQAYFQRVWSSRFSRSTIEDAMLAEASIRCFHPVCDWLDALVWDGKPRLDNWLVNAFDCENTQLHRAISAKFLIAAVRRVRRPGVKFDHMMVLEGAQGMGKSTAVKALFGETWFSDHVPPDLASKDAAQALLGIWCLEFAEIEHLIRAEVETIKAFLSRSVDRYRAPYDRGFLEHPRQCVMVGTTNSDDYLRDTSGNRRVWPVACKSADPGWVEDNRAQLWAEAAVREAAGEAVWLNDEALETTAKAAQDARLSVDVWHDAVTQYLGGKAKVKSADILRDALGVPTERLTRSLEMRVANILRTLKWENKLIKRNRVVARWWLSPTVRATEAKVPTAEGEEGEVATSEDDEATIF